MNSPQSTRASTAAASHTPGPSALDLTPWELRPEDPHSIYAGHEVLAQPDRAGGRIIIARVDERAARLIAAAPELLDALNAISDAVDWSQRNSVSIPSGVLAATIRARAAIAKARGNAEGSCEAAPTGRTE